MRPPVDPLLRREGASRSGWELTADALFTMEAVDLLAAYKAAALLARESRGGKALDLRLGGLARRKRRGMMSGIAPRAAASCKTN
jgi:hypothetical protein